jgi:hypothetical protein
MVTQTATQLFHLVPRNKAAQLIVLHHLVPVVGLETVIAENSFAM